MVDKATELLSFTNFNRVTASIGGFSLLFCLFSYFLRDRLYISEPLPSVIFGLIANKASWAKFEEWGPEREISLNLTRIVLGIQLAVTGVRLPAKYLFTAWQSIAVLLVPVMTIMWIVSALIVYLVVPNFSFLDGLLIGACVTPTDPILCGSIVHGRFADKYVPKRVRDVILAEAGANDGFGYPFLFLALCIYRYSGTEIAKQWIVYTILYEILLGIAYGAVAGFLSQKAMKYTRHYNLVDTDGYFFFVFTMALFIVGTGGLLGIDDLFACFVAGCVLNWNNEYQEATASDSLQPVMELILNLGVFTWIGVTMPWAEFNNIMTVWHFIVIGIAILTFRRAPGLLGFYWAIPEIESFGEALFTGYFGPIAVGALFYLQILLEELEGFGVSESDWLYKVASPVVYFIILSSIVVHGLSITVLGFALNIKEKLDSRPRDESYRSKTSDGEVSTDVAEEISV